jgi:hypothetical protein
LFVCVYNSLHSTPFSLQPLILMSTCVRHLFCSPTLKSSIIR